MAASLLGSAPLAFFAGDFRYMPLVVIPGGLAVALGFLLLGLGILRGRVLPHWAGALLVVGTLAMLGFNEQNDQALFAIPFGIAWTAAGGYAQWRTIRTAGAGGGEL